MFNKLSQDLIDSAKSVLTNEGLKDACWSDYEAIGTKEKDGKTVPNCVPKEETEAGYPHMMYDPDSGDSVEVSNKEEHDIYVEMGWIHEPVSEASVSQAQQKLMAMALAYKRGKMKASDASDEVKKLAKSMSEKDLEDFARTKRSELPQHV